MAIDMAHTTEIPGAKDALVTPSPDAISVHLRSTRNDETAECGWGAVLLSGDPVGEEIEQISDLCNAESAYDADILGASAVLDHIKRKYATARPPSLVIYASKGLCDGIDRTIANGGRPTGKPAFRPLWTYLYELARETGAVFKRMPTWGLAAEISDHANDAARKAVGLAVDPQRHSVGKAACPTPGCGAQCDAFLMKGGRRRAWCRRCRQVFFMDPPVKVPSGRSASP